jgi:hypothetical protein
MHQLLNRSKGLLSVGTCASGSNLTGESGGDSGRLGGMRAWGMRPGISIALSTSDRSRLDAIVSNRNAPQKHV